MAKRGKADSAPAVVPEVIENPDVTLAKADGSQLSNFIGGMQSFFRTAGNLEASAKQKLENARKWKAPTSADEDVEIQRQIKAATQDAKGIGEWWEITSKVSQFHKRLVAGRDRGIGYLDEAKKIWTAQHNDYVDAERRKTAAENERRRQEAEAQAEADRLAELARAEAAALKLERESPDLSDRESVFVALVSTGYTPLDAVKRAGFNGPPQPHAQRLLSLPKITKAIESALQAAAIRKQAAALATQPLDVKPIEEAKPAIARAAGAHDVTRWSGVLEDEKALRDAAFDKPELGIPRDLFVVDEAKLNQYARSLEKRLDEWPGVRAKKTTGVV